MKNIFIGLVLLTLVFTACSTKYPLELGANYSLDYDGNSYLYMLDSNNTVIINSHIIQLEFDSTFIIAEQKPVDLILKETWNNSEMNKKKRDKLFEESFFRHYWVINKNDFSVYGPFEKNEYYQRRKELGVPDELKLKQE